VASLQPGGKVVEPAQHLTARDDERAALYNGFGNALAMGVELALTPAIFALMGLWIDHRLGTKPAFTVGLLLFAFAGMGIRAYYSYTAQFERAEQGKPWKRKS
jgi:F0F1-type ATP synthase assembly protein I